MPLVSWIKFLTVLNILTFGSDEIELILSVSAQGTLRISD